jgi:hypothetical protein
MANRRDRKSDRTNELEELFRYPDLKIKQTRGYGGILARLARQIWLENNVTIATLEQRIRSYVKRVNGTSENTGAKSSKLNPGNIRREIAQPSLTWRQFLTIARINRATRMEIIIVLHEDDAPGGPRSSVHKDIYDLRMNDVEKES